MEDAGLLTAEPGGLPVRGLLVPGRPLVGLLPTELLFLGLVISLYNLLFSFSISRIWNIIFKVNMRGKFKVEVSVLNGFCNGMLLYLFTYTTEQSLYICVIYAVTYNLQKKTF